MALRSRFRRYRRVLRPRVIRVRKSSRMRMRRYRRR